MYRKGMVKLCTPECEQHIKIGDKIFDPEYDEDWESCGVKGHRHPGYGVEVGDVSLPHSCDRWVIGGKEQVRIMIEDLQKVLIILDELKLPEKAVE